MVYRALDAYVNNTIEGTPDSERADSSFFVHPRPQDIQANILGGYHGIMRIGEEVLLEALGIHDPNVSIQAIKKEFGRLSIDIQLRSSESDIDIGNGMILKLCQMSEGYEIPHVTPQEDEEQCYL